MMDADVSNGLNGNEVIDNHADSMDYFTEVAHVVERSFQASPYYV